MRKIILISLCFTLIFIKSGTELSGSVDLADPYSLEQAQKIKDQDGVVDTFSINELRSYWQNLSPPIDSLFADFVLSSTKLGSDRVYALSWLDGRVIQLPTNNYTDIYIQKLSNGKKVLNWIEVNNGEFDLYYAPLPDNLEIFVNELPRKAKIVALP